jgi:hypothetical protein
MHFGQHSTSSSYGLLADSFDCAICPRTVRRSEMLVSAKLLRYVRHHGVLEVTALVGNPLLSHTKGSEQFEEYGCYTVIIRVLELLEPNVVADHFPVLGPWVTWCSDSLFQIFYEGEIVCNSARGVQHGDPLGPLVFCLVLRHFSSGIADIFASAEPTTAALNTSYLDDGVIEHTLGTLSRVLSYLQSLQVQESWTVAELSQMLCLSA